MKNKPKKPLWFKLEPHEDLFIKIFKKLIILITFIILIPFLLIYCIGKTLVYFYDIFIENFWENFEYLIYLLRI